LPLRASENRTRISSAILEALYRFEVARTFTTPESFVAGIGGPEFAIALPIELQRLAPLAALVPATGGSEVICAFATPQIQEMRLPSLHPTFRVRAHP